MNSTHATPFGSVKNTPDHKVPDAVNRSLNRPVKVVKHTMKAFAAEGAPPRNGGRPSMRSRLSVNDKTMANTEVGLCKLNSVDPWLESAWFQPLRLSSENLVSKFAFK